MFNRKRRQIRTLQARIDKLVAQRDEAARGWDDAVSLHSRLAQKATAATEHANRAALAWGAVVRDANQAEGLFARAMRLRRAESRRLRRIIDDQHRQLTDAKAKLLKERERSGKLDDRLATLQVANEAEDWRFIRRAGTTSSPKSTPLQKAS